MTTIDEKKAMLQHLGTAEAYKRLRWELLDALTEADKAYSSKEAELGIVKEGMNLREAELLVVGVEGKNEQERQAKLRLSLRDDEIWASLSGDQLRLEADLAAAKNETSRLNREWAALTTYLRLRTAQIEFLGSG